MTQPPRGAGSRRAPSTARVTTPEPASAKNARFLLLAGIGLLALLWRLGFLYRLRESILFGSLNADSALFWAWSRQLVHPTGAAAPFFFGPLYAYALAIAQWLALPIETVLFVQCFLGAGSVVLLTDAVHRIASRRAAIAVGVLLALNPMLVFFDAQVLMEGLLVLLQSLLIWLVVASGPALARPSRAVIAGLLIGALAEGRAIYALLLIPLLVLVVAISPAPRAALRPAIAIAVAFLAVASLSLVHNLRAGARVAFTYSYGYNLYVGNHAGAPGTFATITETADVGTDASRAGLDWSSEDGRDYLRRKTGRSLTPEESSRYWAAEALDYVRQQPADALAGFGRRVLMLWNQHEYPQIENADEYREVCGPLGLPYLGSFAFLALAACFGIGRAWQSGAAPRWLIAQLAMLTLGTALFFVTDRYRAHLIPALAVLSGCGWETAFAAIPARRVPRGAVIGALAGLFLVLAPLPYIRGARYAWGLYSDLGARWMSRDPTRACIYYAKAVEFEARKQIRWRDDAEGRLERATVYHGFAQALQRTGHLDEAVGYEREAARLAPESASIQAAWAALSGKMSGSGAILQRAWAAAQRNEFAKAESLFAQSVASDPRQPDAWAALVRLRIQRNDVTAAREALERGEAAGLSGASLTLHRALVAAAAGDQDTARRLLAEAPASASLDPVLGSVASAVRQLLNR